MKVPTNHITCKHVLNAIQLQHAGKPDRQINIQFYCHVSLKKSTKNMYAKTISSTGLVEQENACLSCMTLTALFQINILCQANKTMIRFRALLGYNQSKYLVGPAGQSAAQFNKWPLLFMGRNGFNRNYCKQKNTYVFNII